MTAREGQPTVEDIVELMLKECRKENIVYKIEALQRTSAILHSCDIDRMKDIADIILPLLPQVSLACNLCKNSNPASLCVSQYFRWWPSI